MQKPRFFRDFFVFGVVRKADAWRTEAHLSSLRARLEQGRGGPRKRFTKKNITAFNDAVSRLWVNPSPLPRALD
jgi:hypothetical protein